MLEWVVPIEAPRDDPELVLQSLEVQGATLSAPDHPTVCEDDVGEVGADIAYAEAEQPRHCSPRFVRWPNLDVTISGASGSIRMFRTTTRANRIRSR